MDKHKPNERKTDDQLTQETRKTVDDLYRKILGRPADNDGLKHWGMLLESGKITKKEMKEEFLNSYEYKTFLSQPKDKIKFVFNMAKYSLSHPEAGIELGNLYYNSWKDGKYPAHKYTDYSTNIEDVIHRLFPTAVNPKQDLSQLDVHCKQFLKKLEPEKYPSKTRPYPAEHLMNNSSGVLLYLICKILRPEKVVETGVAYGLSSSYILQALHENNYGELYSIDYAFRPWESKQMLGAMIPDNLRDRWKLIYGMASKKLKPLLDSIKPIDIFIHDSAHTYSNQIFEYQSSWDFIRDGGLLISDDITFNNAFYDFSNQKNVKPILYSQMDKNRLEYYRDYNMKIQTFIGILSK